MTSPDMQRAIDKILSEPPRQYTKEEAKKNLIACGILTKDGNIAERYRDIIVKKAR